MYDWLNEALDGRCHVVTASRRLARALTDAYSTRQLEAGRSAWRSPEIRAWPDWLNQQLTMASPQDGLPTRINGHQSRVLWERCLKREVSDPLLNVSMLVRQAQDAWQRLHDWRVPLRDCAAAALGRDQRIFASAATAYQSILQREHWIDEAGMAAFVESLIRERRIETAQEILFAGFDRLTPAAEAVIGVLEEREVTVRRQGPGDAIAKGQVAGFEDPDCEMRAAGAWAREILQQNPDHRVGIVCAGLEQQSERFARMVREGLVPGWQGASERHRHAVNVSYGRRLAGYPLISIALLVLQWSARDLSSVELSRLLRSPALGETPISGRSRLDLRLRDVPARQWTPTMFKRAIGAKLPAGKDAADFMERVAAVEADRDKQPARATPATWAMWINDALEAQNWPGEGTLDSREFQLVNRWRELLNDFARLELVVPGMTCAEALGRLQILASETVFQPEASGSVVDLLGPLEAAGMQFDALWIAGMSAQNWPPPGHPSPLLSRELQRERQMPDAEPEDTHDYALRVLQRLEASSRDLAYSYALTDGDTEQSMSGLLANLGVESAEPRQDPGWHAVTLSGLAGVSVAPADPVPPVAEDETVSGGTGAIQRQFDEPFAAFAFGRLGIRPLHAITPGIPPNVRGSIIHDALQRLYRRIDDRNSIESWSDEQLGDYIDDALRATFARFEANSDRVLGELLVLERKRVRDLLLAVVALDADRTDFEIAALEASREVTIADIAFSLRIDRVDRLPSGELQVFDYKTGKGQQFLGAEKEPKDMQLVVYALALDEPVSDLAYFNVDTRSVNVDGAGRELTPDFDWDGNLRRWLGDVERAVQDLAAGDVRLHPVRTAKSARAFGLLSRIQELQRSVG